MHFDSRKIVRSTLASLIAVQLLSSCGGGDKSPTGPGPNAVGSVIESFSVQGGGTANVRTGDPPTGTTGPAIGVSSSGSAAQGATNQVVIGSMTAFRKIYVSVEGKTGFYEITLPADATSATLYETFGTTAAAGVVTVHYAVATSAGVVGPTQSDNVEVVAVVNGDIQVTLTWDTKTDVDLHVVEPNGDETYYGAETSTSGGLLDLDSNAACLIDDVNNENITWTKAPPHGNYIVRVDFYDDCGVTTTTHYTVTVRRKGRATQTFNGTFTGLGDNGGEGSGTTITTFAFP